MTVAQQKDDVVALSSGQGKLARATETGIALVSIGDLAKRRGDPVGGIIVPTM